VYVALGDDEPAQRLVQKLEKASFLVVQASYTSQLTAEADVVLPVGIWSENTGHYLNLEGRLQEAIQALTATEEILSNQAVLEELAKRLGVSLAGDWKDELFKRISPVALEEAQA
jgi:NADH dehydrogenase/NADH:ubiquinone oxidoreductase subunit G